MGDEELMRPMPAGWTLAALLAHIAFWDARAMYWMNKWGPDGEPTVYEPEDTDAANESTKPLCLALQPGDAAQLALRLAAESDAMVKAPGDEMLRKVRPKRHPPCHLAPAR